MLIGNMQLDTSSFRHDFAPGTINFGRGSITDIGDTFEEQGYESALVVCGTNVGANETLMTAVKDGLGDTLAGVFDETTPEKAIETVHEGSEFAREVDADVLVPVGGGSSLDIATGMSVLGSDGRTLDAARTEIIENGTLSLPADRDRLLPTVPIPTTLAGADLSVAAGLVAYTDNGPKEAVIADEDLMPDALFYDPNLFETTPMDVLAGSAINGFDKGVEAIYSKFANPIVDSTAVRGLRYLRTSLPDLRESDDSEVLKRAVLGTLLVQYGVSIPGAYKINVVHAFGHALRNQFGIQQGVAHAVTVPHVLRLIFEEGGGRPEVLAEGLVLDDDPESTEAAVIRAVEEIRDGLALPSRLRDVEGTTENELGEVAVHVAEDDFLEIGPPEFDPTIEDIEETLRAAW